MEPKTHALKAYRTRRRISCEKFAGRINVSAMTIRRYEAGRMPAQPYLDRIVIRTGGEVTANDWLGEQAAEIVRSLAPKVSPSR